MKGITGIKNEILYEEIKQATEERYPPPDGKIYVPVVVVYEYIRENKDKFPNLNSTTDQHMKRIITQTFSNEFGWKRFGNTRSIGVRSAVFNRSLRDEEQ